MRGATCRRRDALAREFGASAVKQYVYARLLDDDGGLSFVMRCPSTVELSNLVRVQIFFTFIFLETVCLFEIRQKR